MDLNGFEAKLRELERAVMDAVRTHMEEAGHTFDERSFREQASSDMDEFLKELFFYGAQVFPDHPTEIQGHRAEPQDSHDLG